MRQAFAHLGARRAAVEDAVARHVLTPPLWTLFARMDPADQRHALRVLEQLRTGGTVPPELAQAALLHDVGKSATRLTLAHRTAQVLLASLAPQLLALLAADAPGSWRYPFFVQLHHAELGAQACAAAGGGEQLVALIRYHERDVPVGQYDSDLEQELAALRAADDRS